MKCLYKKTAVILLAAIMTFGTSPAASLAGLCFYAPESLESPFGIVAQAADTVPVIGITLSFASKTIAVNETAQLTAEVTPANATNKNVLWSTSDERIASVTESGLVTAVSVGSALITATTVDGGKSAKCIVTVTMPIYRVTGVTLNSTSKTISVGNLYQLSATLAPANATNTNIAWSSSSDDIATVDRVGVVTAHSVGTAIITVATEDGNKTATCTVTVNNPTVSVTGITLPHPSKNIPLGELYQQNATIMPPNATDKSVLWSSTDPLIAAVDEFGVVTALSLGTTTITAATADGDFTAECVVTVIDATVHVTGITVNPTTKSMTVGNTAQLSTAVFPEEATDPSVTWSTSNAAVATVSPTGLVTALTAGSAMITATTVDGGFTAKCFVSVQLPTINVTGIAVVPSGDKTLTVGEAHQLTADISPSNATNQRVAWSTSDAAVATVSPTGLVTALAAGSATVTVTTVDGGFTVECFVSVQLPTINVTGIAIVPSGDKTMAVGAAHQLSAAISPSNATNQCVTWSTSDAAVATVSPTGLVTALAAGSATVTATTADGGFTANCVVTVTLPVVEKSLTHIDIKTPPAKTVYFFKNDSLNISGLTLIAFYSDGTSETISDTSAMDVTGFDIRANGSQTLTVHYGGMAATFDVTVKYSALNWIIIIFLIGWLWYI